MLQKNFYNKNGKKIVEIFPNLFFLLNVQKLQKYGWGDFCG